MELIAEVGLTELILGCANNCEACTGSAVADCTKCDSGYFA